METPKCARIKRDGTPCGNYANLPSKFCRYHGGNAQKGIFSANYRSGRYSQYLPRGLKEMMDVENDDVDLLSLRDEILLIDARIKERLEGLEGGPSKELWDKVQLTIGSLRAMVAAGADAAHIAAGLDQLDRLVLLGQSTDDVWDTVIQAIDVRRRLVEGERKRLVEMNHMITTERAMLLISALSSAVKKNVTDREALSRISSEFIRLTEGHSSEDARPDSIPESVLLR